jgi:hypothetical protein
MLNIAYFDYYGWTCPVFFWQIFIMLGWLSNLICRRKFYLNILLAFTIIFVIISSSLKPFVMVQADLHLLPSKDAPSTYINEHVKILGENNEWCYVKNEHRHGWIEKKHFTKH